MELVTFDSTTTLIQDHKIIMGRGQEEFNPEKCKKEKKKRKIKIPK